MPPIATANAPRANRFRPSFRSDTSVDASCIRSRPSLRQSRSVILNKCRSSLTHLPGRVWSKNVKKAAMTHSVTRVIFGLKSGLVRFCSAGNRDGLPKYLEPVSRGLADRLPRMRVGSAHLWSLWRGSWIRRFWRKSAPGLPESSYCGPALFGPNSPASGAGVRDGRTGTTASALYDSFLSVPIG